MCLFVFVPNAKSDACVKRQALVEGVCGKEKIEPNSSVEENVLVAMNVTFRF